MATDGHEGPNEPKSLQPHYRFAHACMGALSHSQSVSHSLTLSIFHSDLSWISYLFKPKNAPLHIGNQLTGISQDLHNTLYDECTQNPVCTYNVLRTSLHGIECRYPIVFHKCTTTHTITVFSLVHCWIYGTNYGLIIHLSHVCATAAWIFRTLSSNFVKVNDIVMSYIMGLWQHRNLVIIS